MNERRRLRSIALILYLSAASSLGLIGVYLAGGQPQVEGALLGIAVGGIGLALILWAHAFLPVGDSVQQREKLEPAASEEEEVAESARRGMSLLTSRRLLLRSLLAALGALAAAAVLPVRSLAGRRGDELIETPFRKGVRLVDSDGEPIQPTRIPVGGVLTAFPEGDPHAADAVVVLLGLGSSYRSPAERQGWDVDGLVAYSKLCTHLGCPVGLYDARTNQLVCPCHQSVFDMSEGAVPTQGPATRALPQLPLQLSADGFLEAGGEFSEPTGAGFWRLPDVE